jgi:hypothetical protein
VRTDENLPALDMVFQIIPARHLRHGENMFSNAGKARRELEAYTNTRLSQLAMERDLTLRLSSLGTV